MPLPGYTSLFFTVVLLVTSAYFLMGGLPLLILSHDSPVDQKFVHRFFDLHYKAAFLAASGAAISYAFWGRPWFALGAAVIAVMSLLLRQKVLAAMRHIAGQINAQNATAVKAFRQVHLVALLLNLVQLVGLVWGVTQISL